MLDRRAINESSRLQATGKAARKLINPTKARHACGVGADWDLRFANADTNIEVTMP